NCRVRGPESNRQYIGTDVSFSRWITANGKRLSTNFRVPCSPDGQRAGDSTTKATARSTSAANSMAAGSLRSRYQEMADFRSESADGWISGALTAMEHS